MTDHGHDLLFGSFLTPAADRPHQVVALARLTEQVGLDLVTVQDHPYQPAFLDTWTLLSYVGAATERVRLAGNVLNLPLRPPVVLAKSVASLDLLTGGRVELGLGAGAFWDAIEAAGGRRLTPGQAVDALEEAIAVVRAVWATGERGGVRVEGEHHRVVGAKRGPAPAHDVGIWLGALKPRMLRLVGRAADGWLPSLAYLPGGPDDLPALNAIIDEGAVEAGRRPAEVRRLLNVSGRFSATSRGLLDGPPEQWAEELAGLTLDHGVSTFVVTGDDPDLLQVFGAEVAPAARDLVAAERSGTPTGDPSAPLPRGATTPQTPATAPSATTPAAWAVPVPAGLGVTPTPPPTERHSTRQVWDEAQRPLAPAAAEGRAYPRHGAAVGQHLVDVHDHLRGELAQVRDLVRQVEQGVLGAGEARSVLHGMTLRQNGWTLGAYCAAYCTVVTQHHGLEDQAIFPHLRDADPALAPVVDRLEQEHVVIHEVVEGVDRALVRYVEDPTDTRGLREAVDVLTDALLSHLSYEEHQLVEPLARLGFYPGLVG